MFVLLGDGTSEANQPPNIGVPGDQSDLIASLQDQVRYLREQLDVEREARTEERRRHDTIVAQLTSKIPAIEAPQEPTEAAETVEETPDKAEPHPATEGSQAGTERPQQRSGWLAPVDKLPWWHYVLGISVVFLAMFNLDSFSDIVFGSPLPGPIRYAIVFAVLWTPPGIFGFWVGFRRRNLRLGSQIIPVGALVAVIAALGIRISGVVILYGPTVVLLFGVWLLYVSGALLGNALQRRRTGRISGTTPTSPVSRATQSAGQQPRKDLTPAQQAMLGWGGTIISALITLVGTIITVGSGS